MILAPAGVMDDQRQRKLPSSTVAFAAAAAVLVVTSTFGLLAEHAVPVGGGWMLRGTLPAAATPSPARG